MAKYSTNWKSEKKRLRDEALAKTAAEQAAKRASEMPELWHLLTRYRGNDWVVQALDTAGNVVPDESPNVSFWVLTPPGWAPVIVRGGVAELRRKAGCLR